MRNMLRRVYLLQLILRLALLSHESVHVIYAQHDLIDDESLKQCDPKCTNADPAHLQKQHSESLISIAEHEQLDQDASNCFAWSKESKIELSADLDDHIFTEQCQLDKVIGGALDSSFLLSGTEIENDTVESSTTINTPEEFPECGLYMAESSIPNAGWGMYTALPIQRGEYIFPSSDVVIHANDIKEYRNIYNRHHDTPIPKWLLKEYFWNPRVTGAKFDAWVVESILPGLGMLANSHTGLVNIENLGPKVKEMARRDLPSAGAFTEYRNLTFMALHDIPAGHELFVEYGDEWFQDRKQNFGEEIPLSNDWNQADNIMATLDQLCEGNLTAPFCTDLWTLVRHDISVAVEPSLLTALPETIQEVMNILESGQGTAHHSVPNLIRSPEWLRHYGLCIDHMTADVSKISGLGAFATRALPRGTIVAPAPVVHLHRGHLELFVVDSDEKSQIHWKGHQLLLNYVYGHPDSSLVFFPYSPITNLINHSRDPNTKLRWSAAQSKPEWLDLTTEELIHENTHTGLMMEFVAIRDIEEGEEITVDYGEAWEQAWDQHVKKWVQPTNSEEFTGAHAWRDLDDLPEHDEQRPEKALPTNVMTVCWIDFENVDRSTDATDTTWTWKSADTDFVSDAKRCWILSQAEDKTYTVSIFVNQIYQNVHQVPRHAIEIVDRPYTGNQYLRNAFRHEAYLPDNMVPEKWRDLAVISEECQYFMAKSSIPHAGLGMYTAKDIKENRDIFFSDLVVQVEDIDLNKQLRNWYNDVDEETPDWLMENYYWQPHNTGGTFDAIDIQSIVPGLGMLANSHDGLVNAHMVRPSIWNSNLERHRDPGAGAVTYYHNLKFTAGDNIDAGSEIFVQYGSAWFLDRADTMGPVPVFDDFVEADKLLLDFWNIIGGDPDTEMARELWELLWNTSSPVEDNRVRMALPRELEKVEKVLNIGTARNSVPDSIRSIDWLRENGRCLDNIMPRQSTIEQAGMGAFATRHVSKGEVVSPAPLVHIRREHLELYNSHDVDNSNAKPWFEGHQLILNYCYGHPSSSILLFPYAPVTNYINHNKDAANVELRWSSLPNHQSDWFDRSVDDLMEEDHAGLIMEFVATRDILPNEEIFLNYGDAWDKKWISHLKTWSPTRSAKGYVGPWHYNNFLIPTLTLEEQKTSPYPDNMFCGCYVGHVNEEQVATRSEYGDLTYEWTFNDYLYVKTTRVYPCEILERHGTDDDTTQSVRPSQETYTARVFVGKNNQIEWILRNVPRRAIEYFDDTYEGDGLVQGGFRQEIELPEHMVPDAWKDLQEEQPILRRFSVSIHEESST